MDDAYAHAMKLQKCKLNTWGVTLALSILFYILIEEREKLALDQELVLYTYFKIM